MSDGRLCIRQIRHKTAKNCNNNNNRGGINADTLADCHKSLCLFGHFNYHSKLLLLNVVAVDKISSLELIGKLEQNLL